MEKCWICGKEMVNTIGGNYHCPTCGVGVNDLVYRPSNCDIPIPQDFGVQKGWICPICGRGVSPWADTCPCQKDAGVTNVTTTTEPVDLSKYYTLINDGTVPEARL